jgi:amino acid adenylation domain-containing protein/non-ribosomal peptide synthase protein (TIGR01720 family)
MGYWTSMYSDAHAKNIVEAFKQALIQISGPSAGKVEAVNLFSDHHHRQVSGWNKNKLMIEHSCLHNLVESQSASQLDAPAVCGHDASFSYAMLDDLSTKLAFHLASQCNVGPEVLVPFCFEKSAWAIVAMLAILKAGGACVALNKSHPDDWLKAIMEDCSATTVLVSSEQTARFASLVPKVVEVSAASLSQLPQVEPSRMNDLHRAQPSNAAFVVFTSGSTGKPKGIVLSHAALCTSARDHGTVMRITSSSRVLQFAAYTFDVSIGEIFTTLSRGGCVCVPSDYDRMNNLANVMRDMKVDWAYLTPTVATLIQPGQVILETLCLGGEAVKQENVATWAGYTHLINIYGPAETTIWSTALTGLTATTSAANIGRTTGPGAAMWIVNADNYNTLVPIGCVGELLIEGPILARGYLNDSIRTADSFITDPTWATGRDRRFYRTRDLARYNSDGTIEFMGRKDTQVKLHGQRIELSQIESVLKPQIQQWGVSDAVVEVAHAGQDMVLVAFFTTYSTNTDECTLLEGLPDNVQDMLPHIQSEIAKKLPLYMVPAVYLHVSKMPTTVSGKLDRKSLRQMVLQLPSVTVAKLRYSHGPKRSPSTETEKSLAMLWSRILHIETELIGVDDSFFRLGGDSVGAMRLVAMARSELGIVLNVADIFGHPTIQEMSSNTKVQVAQDTAVAMQPFVLLDQTTDSLDDLQRELASHCSIDIGHLQDAYPTTALQEGLLALSSKQSSAYVAQNVFVMPTSLDRARFQAAWDAVVKAVDILRTRIVNIERLGTLQVVIDQGVEWEVADSLPAYLDADRSRPMRFGSTLARYAIVEDKYFVWTAHHALYDGVSVQAIQEKVALAYEETSTLESSPFKPFIKYIKNMSVSDQAAYWTTALDGAQAPVFPSITTESAANGRLKQSFARTVSFSTQSLKASEITVSTLLRAAWAIVLARQSESDEAVFGVTLSGRNAPVEGIEKLIGPMITTVPIRFQLRKSGTTIGGFLRDVQSQAAGMIPFEQMGLQSIKRLSQSAENACDFRTLLVVQPRETAGLDTLGLQLQSMGSDDFHSHPIVVECNIEGTNTVEVHVDFDANIISAGQMEGVINQFGHVAHQLAEHAEDYSTDLSMVNLLSERDWDMIMQWNSVTPQSANACLHELVERQVAATPDAMAIDGPDASFTFMELEHASTKLAYELVELGGIDPGTFVPFCFDKSAFTIVAMYAIMKAGGACVALNPDHPMDRLQSIIREISPPLMVVGSAQRQKFDNIYSICVDKEHLDSLPDLKLNKTAAEVSPLDPGFAVFTSGSTGKPKGIVLSHDSLCTSIKAHGKVLRLDVTSRVLQFCAYTFDVSIAEIFTTLVHGGCVCIPTEAERLDDLGDAINRMNVNWAYMTPTVASLLPQPNQLPSLKTLGLTGEPITKENISKWAEHVRLVNMYGPAETTIWTTAALDLQPLSAVSNIGYGCGALTWIVEEENHNLLTPVGCVGELLIEGPIVARGYLNDEVRTENAFIENPEWANSCGITRRFYKTGDLVRYAFDGSLQLVGRKDTQVKLRGQRIELAEVEGALRRYLSAASGIVDIAVEMVELAQRSNDRVLVAFFARHAHGEQDDVLAVMDDELKCDLIRVQNAVVQELPLYMIPSLYIPLHHMPISVSAKRDRKQLQALARGLTSDAISGYTLATETTGKRAPSTAMEQVLQSLWATTLGIPADTIGAGDDFFRVGGDSIAAMRLAARVQEKGMALTVAHIFKNQRLCDMARAMTASTKTQVVEPFSLVSQSMDVDGVLEEAAAMCQMERATIEDIYPCTPLQEGLMALSARQSGSYVAQNIFCLSDIENLDLARFRNAWETTVRVTEIMRTRIVYLQTVGALQVVLKQPITWEESSSLQGYLVQAANASQSYAGPLVRFGIVNDGTKLYFVWTAHHALYDGFSLPLILQRFQQAYEGSALTSPTSFNRFISYLQNIEPMAWKDYWHTQLKDASQFSFPGKLSGGIQNLSRVKQSIHISGGKYNFTTSTILRAAWALMLSRYSDSDDVVFGATVSGRNAPVDGIDQLVGPTIATVPIRARLDRQNSIENLLSAMQDQATDMIPFEHVGLQNIRQLGRYAQAACDFQNLLIIQPRVTDAEDHTSLLKVTTTGNDVVHPYPLAVECNIDETTIDLVIDYDTGILSAFQLQRMIYQFEHIINLLRTAALETRLSDLDLLSQSDKQQIWDWNSIEPAAEEACVHHGVEEMVRLAPDAQAVDAWDGQMTYRDLDVAANRLAHHLVAQGVGPEVMVAMCFDKSIWNVVSMLAVLKAGGVCVALNPEHPMRRHRIILDDIKAKVLVVATKHQSLFEGEVDNIITVDATFLESLPEYQSHVLPAVKADNASFVVFTSGSTGKPKEIVLTHRAMSTCTRELSAAMRISASSRVLQFAAHTFDVSIGEIFITLMVGGCVCVPSDTQRAEPGLAINTYNVNWCYLTSTVASLFRPLDTPNLKTLALGGEAVKQDLIHQWAGNVFLVNVYGPAEATIWCTAQSNVSTSSSAANIGKGLATLTWIADVRNHNLLAPIGTVGELLIEGPLLARHYLNEPEKTAAAFVTNPEFLNDSITPRRLYKTGDLARYNADGSLDIMGRKDTQVKLFGQRIELGEIEHHLKPHLEPLGLSQLAVEMVKPQSSGQALLAAFMSGPSQEQEAEQVAAQPISNITRETLLSADRALATVLPLYMIPSLFIPLNYMPQTTSGKTDRKRLRQLAGEDLSADEISGFGLSSNNVVPVSGDVQLRLRDLWVEVLGVSAASIGANSNFMRLGGDSIGAMKLVAVSRGKGLAVSIGDIFRHPVLQDMAAATTTTDMSDDIDVVERFSMIKDAENLQHHIQQAASQCGVDASAVQDMYPATSLQEGLLALSVKAPGAYMAQHCFELSQDIDLDRFKSAWNWAVSSMDILRTRVIYSSQHGSLQIVLDSGIEWHNSLSIDTCLRDAQEMSVEYGGSLTRYTLVQEGDKVFFVWSVHHALFDGGSMAIMTEKVAEAYDNLPSAPLSEPFNTFVKYLIDADLTAAETFWRSELDDANPPSFPPATTSAEQNRMSLNQDIELPSNSTELSYTLPNLIKAAWAMLLARYSETDDVVFGLTLSGRNAPVRNISTIVGPTITTAPLRVKVPTTTSVSEFLDAVQAQATDMIPYEHTGLQKIQRFAPQFSAICDIRSLLVVQPRMEDDNDQKSLIMKPVNHTQINFHTYPLVAECNVNRSGIDVEFQYDANSIASAQMENFSAQFVQILRELMSAAFSKPQMKVADIDMVSPLEKQKIMAWNSDEPALVERCAHEIIREQAMRRPDALAVDAWDAALTFAQLDQLSEQLSTHLISLGVGPEVLVPFCMDKSAWVIVATLGTLKAGGACVALNPAHPIDRLQVILRETAAKIVLVGPEYSDMFKGTCQSVVIDKTLPERLQASPGYNTPERNASGPDNASFVVFTSGSTGVPKGIVLEHKALCSSAKAHGVAMRLQESSRVLQFAAHTFDVSIGEIFSTLMHGGCVCVPSERDRMENLVGFINKFRINSCYLTPTVANLMYPQDVPTIETLSLGGEALRPEHVARWADHVYLNNLYGPAETTIWSTGLTAVTASTSASNIGVGVGGKMWITEPQNPDRLCAIGSVGELLIEGPILARGYLNEPEKTTAAFIYDPLWTQSHGSDTTRRFYRTGDLVYHNPDGTLEFVGRRDNQVKIRGQRVELGEVECHVSAHPSVQHAAVIMPQSGYFEGLLVAVMSTCPTRSGAVDLQLLNSEECEAAASWIRELGRNIMERLPSYMVPGIWITVEKLPQNASGKLDKKAVKIWTEQVDEDMYKQITTSAVEEDAVVAVANNEREARIQQLWANVLNVPLHLVATNQPFVVLGGDSITAMQLVSLFRSENIGKVTVKDILQCANIPQLAAMTEPIKNSKVFAVEETDKPFDLTPVQQLYFSIAPEANTKFHQSLTLRITRPTGEQKILGAVNEMVHHHSMLRSRFVRSAAGKWMQFVNPDVVGSYIFESHEVADIPETMELMTATQERLNVEYGPMLAVDLYNMKDGGQMLFVSAHHLIMDLFSWRVLLVDMENLLGGGSLATEKPFPFQVWSKLQADYAREQLSPSTVLPTIDIPSANLEYWGMAGKPNKAADIVRCDFSLDVATTASLLGICNQALRTEPLDILLAALVSSFVSTFPDRDAPPVYSESHGREAWDSAIDLSRTVGWFTTIAPTYVPATAEDGTFEILRRIKDTRKATPANGWEYFCSRYLNPEGAETFKNHWPMEILFNYQGQYQQLERSDSLITFESLPMPEVGGDMERFALIEIQALIVHGAARFSFAYNNGIDQTRVHKWVDTFETTLQDAVRDLTSHVLEPTLSDFPLLPATYSSLDKLMKERLPAMGVESYDQLEDVYPCSPIQEGILISQERIPGAYELSVIAEVVPTQPYTSVSIDRLKLAWQQVIDRHSMLRTVLSRAVTPGSLFMQVVLKHAEARISHLKCTDESAAQAALEVAHRLQSNGTEPSHHLTLCETSSGKVFCRLTINHALTDAASNAIIFRDLTTAYEGKMTKMSVAPRYRDHIRYLSGVSMEDSLNYWKGLLVDVSPCHFRATGEGEKDNGATKELDLDIRSLPALRNFAKINNLTLNSLFQAAWAMVLRIFTGAEDVLFGFLSSGRDVPIDGIADAVGPFINMMVCRSNAGAETSLLAMANAIQGSFANSLQHQHCSLAKIQQALNLGGQPLFNTAMTFMPGSGAEGERTPEIAFKHKGGQDPTEYDIGVGVLASDQHIVAKLKYRASCMSVAQARNVGYAFTKALENLVHTPHSLLGELDLFAEDHREQVMTWNATMPALVDMCSHDEIMKRTAESPEATAISAWDGELTYGELDRITHNLAQSLASYGVGPEVVVPLCFEKSIWAVVAMISVVKAGGSLLFLDPSHPEERRQFIMHKVSASLVMASSQHSALFTSKINTLTINGDMIRDLPICNGPPKSNVKPSNLMYVIFTSGSTGTPKGCMVEHRNFCSGVVHQRVPSNTIKHGDRVLQLASYSFDVSIMETFTALMNGACVCIPHQATVASSLTSVINEMGITWAFLTPSLARVINPSDITGMRSIVLGGEAVSRADVAKWAGGVVQISNGYGPSECSIAATCNPTLTLQSDPNNIGGPMGGLCWVVEAANHDRLVPIGAVGELLIEGPIVARGYLKNAEKTAAVFVENPAWLKIEGLSVRRMYKTGDLVRQNADGTINFVGRKDDQVKLRGQRIELGEIEHHVHSDPQVHHAMVLRISQGLLKGRLVAVLTLRNVEEEKEAIGGIALLGKDQIAAAGVKLAELRDTLGDHVPGYMVPTTWVAIKRMPLTASGKLNRNVVKSWLDGMDSDTYTQVNEAMVAEEETDNTEPKSPMESIIQKIYGQVLGISAEEVSNLESSCRIYNGANKCKVHMGLSFLSLGGDSISAMQVMGQLREENITISIRDILRSKNIAELAAMAKTAEQADALVPIETVNTLFPLSPAQRMFFDLASDPKQQFNQSFTLRLKTSVSPVALEAALRSVIQRHSMLRSRFQRVDGDEWAQLISADVTGSYEFREQHATTTHNLLPVAVELQRSLDIEHGPIVGVGSFTVDGGDHLLYLVAHHLTIDLVSWRIIMADLTELIQGRPGSQIPPFPFQAWTQMQAEQAREQLSPAKVLPFEVPAADYAFWGMDDQANTYRDNAEIGFKLDSDTTTMLLGSCNTAMGTEPVDIFLAALIHSFAQNFTERAPPALFSESHGREPWSADIDLSRTVGWFTAISPIFVAGGKDMVDLVRRVKDIRRSVPGNGRPYFASRYLNATCREAFDKHWPVEVLFNYHGLYQQQERDDSAFEIVPLTPEDFSQDLQRLALFDISATVSHGVAEFSMTHSRAMKHQDRIAQWMSTFKNSLSQAVFELVAIEQGQKTLSDFPLLPFNRFANLDALKKGLHAVDIKSLADVEDIYPCSPMQDSILAAQGRNGSYYQICNVFELKGTISVSRLHRAWQAVVDRHPILRTTFLAPSSAYGSSRLQIVRRPGVQVARIQHIGDVPVNSGAELGFLCPPQISHDDSNKGFSPHFLTTAVSSDGARIYMRVEMSHALIDGASLQTLLSEFGAAYEQNEPWTEPAPKFSNHVERLLAAEQEKKTGEAMQYWQKYVKSVAAEHWSSLRVPDNTRYASTSSSSSSYSRSSSPSSSFSSPHDLLRTAVVPPRYMPSVDAMHACCTTHGVTQSSILHAAWALVLSLRNGGVSSPRPAFAYLIAGREDADDNNSMASAVGPFFSTLICALGVSQDKTLKHMLSDAQSDSVAGMEAASAAPWVKSILDADDRAHVESMINFRKYISTKTRNKHREERDTSASAGDIEALGTVAVHDPFEYDVVVEAEEDGKGAMVVELKYWGNRVEDSEAEVLATRLARVTSMLVVDSSVTVEALRRAIIG